MAEPELAVGDYFLLRPPPGRLPYVARATKLWEQNGEQFLCTRWLYRPCDTALKDRKCAAANA